MRKQYKLLKDLPGTKAGTIFNYGKVFGGNLFSCEDEFSILIREEVENLQDWFEPVRWKPEYGQTYYYVDSTGERDLDRWTDDDIDLARYAVGNCFQTTNECDKVAEKYPTIFN